MKKLFSLLLTIAMIMSMSSAVFAVDFTDVDNTHTNYEAIETLETLGIVNGYGDETYGPDRVLTRAELAAMLTRAMYTIHYNSTDVFTDVPVNHWARSYIDTAQRNGLMVGNGNGTFTPDENLTYTQIARTILNALGYGALDWPVGVNTVAYELGLYENIDVVDFETGCIRAHAAQMLFNAFDLQCVRQYAGQHFVTNKTFLKDLLGYEVTSEYVNGHIYTAYEKIATKDVVVTDICETYEATIYPAKGTGGDMGYGYKLSKRGTVTEVNWYWVADNKRPPVYCYVNGVEITSGSEAWFAACESATGVFDSDDNLTAIYIVNKGVSYSPMSRAEMLIDLNELVRFELAHDKDYNEDVSTVTYFAESDTYIISNTIVSGFVTDIARKTLEIDDIAYELNATPYNCTLGGYAVIYFDYLGNVVDYQPITNPYRFNLVLKQYHTVECPIYQSSIWTDAVWNQWTDTIEGVAAALTNPNGYELFFGCEHCHTNGRLLPVLVPTGIEPVVYVTADGWTYYHDSTCTEVTKPENANAELIYINDITTCGKKPHTCCDGSN